VAGTVCAVRLASGEMLDRHADMAIRVTGRDLFPDDPDV
jgi:hypothetical protein